MKTDWKKIKKEYICTNLSLSKLSKKHGVSLSTMKKRCSAEGWNKLRTEAKVKADKLFEEARQLSAEKTAEDRAQTLDKIYEVAKKLIDSIDCSIMINDTALKEIAKPSSISKYSTALKTLTDIVRDVSGLQTVGEKQDFELKREKLDFEKQKASLNRFDDDESGVVLLPEVKDE